MSGFFEGLAKAVMAGFLEDLAEAVEAAMKGHNSTTDLDDEMKKKAQTAVIVELKDDDDAHHQDLDDEMKKKAQTAVIVVLNDDDAHHQDLDDEMKKKETTAPNSTIDDEKKTSAAGAWLKDVAIGVGVTAGASLLALGAARLVQGSSSGPPEKQPPTKRRKPKDMVAPGKNPIRIERKGFEDNPANYFRQARAEKKLTKQLINGISATTK